MFDDGNENNEGSVPVENFWRLDKWFPHINQNALNLFKIYNEELQRFNKALNLVSPKTLRFADVIHFADSILASEIVLKDGKFSKIYDFGSGNGFPGIVLGILAPQVEVILVDSDSKKIEFLKHVIGECKLKNVRCLTERVENLPAGSISHAIARGFMPLAKAIYNTRGLFPHNGCFYHLKGEEWGYEIASIPSQLCSVWMPTLVSEYKLPVGGVKFAVVKTLKI